MMSAIFLKSLWALLLVLALPTPVSQDGVVLETRGPKTAWDLHRGYDDVVDAQPQVTRFLEREMTLGGSFEIGAGTLAVRHPEIPVLEPATNPPPREEQDRGDFTFRISQQSAIRTVSGIELVEQTRPDRHPQRGSHHRSAEKTHLG